MITLPSRTHENKNTGIGFLPEARQAYIFELHLQIIDQTVWYMLQTFNEVYLRKLADYFHFMKPVVTRLLMAMQKNCIIYGRINHIVYMYIFKA